MRRIMLPVLLVAALPGCARLSDSRLNPFNWFGGAPPAVETAVAPAAQPEDPRPLVAEVTALTLEPVPGGAILRATGLPPTMGYWDAGLTADAPLAEGDADILALRFRALPPVAPQPQGTARAREVTVARFLSDQTLRETRTIRVEAQGNARTIRP